MVRALVFYRGGLGSNPIRDVGFFQAMHHLLFTNFHIRKKLYVRFLYSVCNSPYSKYNAVKVLIRSRSYFFCLSFLHALCINILFKTIICMGQLTVAALFIVARRPQHCPELRLA